MKALRELQKQYLEGKLTQAQYEAAVRKLLADDKIDDEQLDEALEYDPEAERPQFTQADVDRMVVAKAAKMVRKALKDAGVEGLDSVGNKELLPEIAKMLKDGGSKGDGTKVGNYDIKDVEAWKKAADKVLGLGAKVKDLTVENSVLKAAGKYNPINAAQVVRALKLDYLDLIDIDDEGTVDSKTVDRALRKIYDAEPNLFHKEEGQGGEGDQGNKGGSFKGKGPGGGTGGGSDKDADFNKKKAEGLAMLGIKTETTK